MALAPYYDNNHPDNQVNDRIGRCGAGGGTAHLTSLKRVRDWCDQHGVLFKVMLFVIFVVRRFGYFLFQAEHGGEQPQLDGGHGLRG